MLGYELIALIQKQIDLYGDQDVLVDDGIFLREIDACELGASDEGIVIWVGEEV